ncbi:MAG: serine hydrolase [Pseudomonadota bacterium]
MTLLAGARPGFMGLAALGLLSIACAQAPEPPPPPVSPPAERDDGWPVASLGEAGFDEAAMAALTDSIRTGALSNTHALVIEHRGRLVYEAYFKGEDERWGRPLGTVRFDQDTLHDLRSVTKSVTSALLGIALADNIDESLKRPLIVTFDDLKETFDDGAAQVTLYHTLTMTAGLEWNEMSVPYTDPSNDEIRMVYAEDPVAMVLARPLRDPPGSAWYYNGGLTQVLAGVIERQTGQPIDAFAEDALFAPLGITDYEWLGSPLWAEGSSPSAASGLRLRARDLAKIGSVMLHDGVWQGRQVIPARWVALSTERHVAEIPWSPSGVYGYGFMWYPGRSKDERATRIVRAAGNGGQRLYILPDEGIVITLFADLYNQRSDWIGERILGEVLAAYRPASER